MKDEQEHTTLKLQDIALQNLEVQSVRELVAAMIGSASGEQKLCNLIVTKTRGNPFHVVQFIQVIQREGLLSTIPIRHCGNLMLTKFKVK